MRYKSTAAALAACVLLLSACGGGEPAGSGELARPLAAAPSDPAMTVKLSVLSSAPEFVSGGDARIHVRAAPGQRDKLALLLNGQPVNVTLKEVADGLEGVVTGLRDGSNLLQVKHGNVRDAITLTNYPITGPMFTGPQQTPFVCTTIQGAVGRQPLVDSTTVAWLHGRRRGRQHHRLQPQLLDRDLRHLSVSHHQRRAVSRCPPMAVGRRT